MSRVEAKRIPETASVAHRPVTENVSWQSPSPAAPRRTASQAWKAMPMQLISRETPVSSSVFFNRLRDNISEPMRRPPQIDARRKRRRATAAYGDLCALALRHSR